jgi:hypothetical protein
MDRTVAERTFLWVNCAICGQPTRKAVAWLAARDAMCCFNCGCPVDLASAENKILIHETEQSCANIETKLGELRRKPLPS